MIIIFEKYSNLKNIIYELNVAFENFKKLYTKVDFNNELFIDINILLTNFNSFEFLLEYYSDKTLPILNYLEYKLKENNINFASNNYTSGANAIGVIKVKKINFTIKDFDKLLKVANEINENDYDLYLDVKSYNL